MVRLALGFGSKLRRGILDRSSARRPVTVRLGGAEPGPHAVHEAARLSASPARLLRRRRHRKLPKAYLRGEWDTPDLTQFLYLFCVNHDLTQTMLSDKPLVRYVQRVQHWFNRNTRRQARP